MTNAVVSITFENLTAATSFANEMALTLGELALDITVDNDPESEANECLC